MRKGWRVVVTVGVWLSLFCVANRVPAAPNAPEPPQNPAPSTSHGPVVRMTVELFWQVPPASDAPTISLSLSEGRILGIVAVPETSDPIGAPRPGLSVPDAQGSWRIAHGDDRTGRLRVRVEAPLGASLNVEGAGQVVPFLLLGLVDGPLRSAPPARLDLSVERVPWDTVEVRAEGNGLIAPGSSTPVTIGLNVLSTEFAQVQVHLTATLRPISGGQPIWQQDLQEIVATNAVEPQSLLLAVRVPELTVEGTYGLELQASWEPVASGRSSRLLGLSQLLRRRKTGNGKGELVRNASFVVFAPDPRPQAAPGVPAKLGEDVEVDFFDFARPRSHRPSATGRTPTLTIMGPAWRVPDEALVEETRRDRLRGWIPRTAGEPTVLAAADSQGFAWMAIGLKSPRPDRPHRLTLNVQGDAPENLAVAVMSSGGNRPRVVLDAVASTGNARTMPARAGKSKLTSYSWLVWPDAPEPVLVLMNRDPRASVHLEGVSLVEMADLLPGDGLGPTASGPRWLAFSVNPRQAVQRFGGSNDPWVAARNLGRYASSFGANAVILSDRLADRERRQALQGQAVADPLGPDRLDLTLRWLDRLGLAAWIDLDTEGTLPGLPEAGSPEALSLGLVRVDRRGNVDGHPSYQTIHPHVREALGKKLAAVVSRRRDRGNLAGVVLRLGQGPTLLGRHDTGLDDTTFQRFVSESFAPDLAHEIPGLDNAVPDRFEVRASYVENAGKLPWLAWRAKQVAGLYSDLSRIARTSGSGASLAVVTPTLEDGPAGEEMRRLDLLGLGADQAWKSVGLDFSVWPSDENSPIVWRGVTPSDAGELDHDLSTSPDLDEPVVSRPRRGIALTDGSRGVRGALPPASLKDEELALTARASALSDELTGHALAVFDPRWIVLTPDAVSGREERIRRFARLVTLLPAPAEQPAEPVRTTGIAVRAETAPGGKETVVSLVNDTPYPILLETVLKVPETAKVFDLARRCGLEAEPVPGGKRVVLALEPFGISALSIDVPNVAVALAEPHPGPGVLEELKIHSDVISATLVRLNRAVGDDERTSPQNSGFEPPAGFEVRRTKAGSVDDMERLIATTPGWSALSPSIAEIDLVKPYRGAGSLRVTANALPAAVQSELFAPSGRPSLTIQSWLKSDRPDLRIRVWLEGQAAGQPFSRFTDVTATTEWRPISLLAAAIPGGGLDSARLRFELLGAPAKLWIDEVNVTGSPLTEPERLNARRDLLAALSAFHEKRYGDFARLAGSHWARHVSAGFDSSTLGHSPSALAERTGLIRTGEPAGSALPTPRRLR